VPIFARFFLGGILDLRGFRFRSVGSRLRLNQTLDPNSPPIPDGAVIGGNLMYLQNLEVEFPLLEAVGVRGVLFTDAGNAWNLENLYCLAGGDATPLNQASNNPCFDKSFPNLRTSYGFGVRWFSPLGPLRFEWGFPFAPYSYEDTSVFEFTIGNFF
jgi:outer membrane protein insertion porin family